MGNKVDEIRTKAEEAKAEIDKVTKAKVDAIQQVCRHEFVSDRFIIGFEIDKCTKCNLTKRAPCFHEFAPKRPTIDGEIVVIDCEVDDFHQSTRPYFIAICTKCGFEKKLTAGCNCPKCLGVNVICEGRFENGYISDINKPKLRQADLPDCVSGFTSATAQWIEVYYCPDCGCKFATMDRNIPIP